MTAMAPVLALLLAAASPLAGKPSPSGSPPSSPATSPSAAPSAPVVLFLMDNSASLPPLDPAEKRMEALSKMFTFVEGHPHRLILFGGRKEISVDDVTRYRNDGQWTDFYFVFVRAREIVAEYPPRTEFRMILLTDALLDPSPRDWEDQGLPAGDLKDAVKSRLLRLLREMKVPLYVILVGELPTEGYAPNDPERTPLLILEMVRAANGAAASPAAQTLSSFFKDDGLLLKKFVFRIAPGEGLKKVEPVVRRITAPARPSVELQFFTFGILPLTTVLFVLVGVLVRSFPGPGDLEIVELSRGEPVHVAADRLHRREEGRWSGTGLSRVTDAREAAATFTYQAPALDLTGMGLDTEGLERLAQRLLPLGLEELRRELESMAETGGKDEKIFALNLDYMAKSLEAREAERVLTASPGERRMLGAMDFLRAKTHLVYDEDLRKKLTEPRVLMSSYGRRAERKELTVASQARIGRYGFVVKELVHGGRKDLRLVLYYDRVPSLLGLKTVLPDLFQRAFRLRRSSQRLVT